MASSKYYEESTSQKRYGQKSSSTARGNTSQRYGLILLGNSGVGKSFLANCCLQKEIFEHKPKPSSVTSKTEHEELEVDGTTYVVFNIPGLIEADNDKIDENKKEIDKAFEECPNSVVIYVFGTQEGRIRNEDIVAFNSLHSAYPFESQSLILVVNGIPPDRDTNYEGETITLLEKGLRMPDACENMCFLLRIDKKKPEEVKMVSEKLFESIMSSLPRTHHKEHDIELNIQMIQRLVEEIDEMQKKFQQERADLIAEFQRQQKESERKAEKRRKHYKKLLRKYEKKLADSTKQKTEKTENTQKTENTEKTHQQVHAKKQDHDDGDEDDCPFAGLLEGVVKGTFNALTGTKHGGILYSNPVTGALAGLTSDMAKIAKKK